MRKRHSSKTTTHSDSSSVASDARKNVQLAAEKLKELNLMEDFLQLEGIQKVLNCLECDNGERDESGSCNLEDHYEDNDHNKPNRRLGRNAGGGKNVDKRFANGISYFYHTIVNKYLFYLNPRKLSASNCFGVFFSILALIFYFELHTTPGFTKMVLKWENVELRSVECTIDSPNAAMELFRPPVECDICRDVTSVDRVDNISPKDFERLYAYSGRPVVITDAMRNWTAVSSFSFHFFKGIYEEGSRSLEHLGEDCLFFPYATEFRTLAEVFNMSKERYLQPWYIGWSNCDAQVSHTLREHYQRPYFLPETAESTHADWIFMGTPGFGAQMHIDHVINPSWQAQILGKKRWFLQPPPECFYECQSFSVDVFPGDTIIIDTNKWYHQTKILPDQISVTIGSEYD